MFYRRAPPWFREEPLIQTINDETEYTILNSYWDVQTAFPKQPAQLWPTFTKKEYSFEGKVWRNQGFINAELKGSYPLNYDFQIKTNENEIPGPIEISGQNATLRVLENLPEESVIDLTPDRTLRINNTEVFTRNNESQLTDDLLIEFGKSKHYHSLKQEFILTKHQLKEIEIAFGPTIGNPTDKIIISIGHKEEILISKEISVDTIREHKDSPIKIGFEENLIAGKTYYLLIERKGDINYENYFTIKGSETPYENGKLYGYKEKWVDTEKSIYFITRTPPLSFLENFGNTEDNLVREVSFFEEEKFEEIEILFGKSVGTPTRNVVFKLLKDGELLERQEIKSETIHEYEEKTLIITLSKKYAEGDYSYKLEIEHQEESGNFYTFVTFEDIYPSLYPPFDEICFSCPNAPETFENYLELTGKTCGVEFESVHMRAYSLEIYPLKKIEIFLKRENSADMIGEAQFEKALNQTCFVTEIKKKNIEAEILRLPIELYAKIEFWGRKYKKTIHFPVGRGTGNEINENLNKIGDAYGLPRREYKKSIGYEDYPYTYPIGYPWQDEQDYWYEKRIINEYATRFDKQDRVKLYEFRQEDVPEKPILELRAKAPDIHSVEIVVGEKGLDCDDLCPDEVIQKITITDTDTHNLITQEEYTYTGNIIKLMDEINFESKILEATYLNSTREALEVGTFFLKTEGTYQNYGLIKAEINQYLGVIPKIKDMVDYCLIYDKKEWDNYVWAGDQWDAGVFELHIPIDKIPKNFRLLTMEEITQIISRCKAFGTQVLPMYYSEFLLKTRLETDFKHAEFIMENEPVEFESILADNYASVVAQFKAQLWSGEGGSGSEVGLSFSIDREIAMLIESAVDLTGGDYSGTVQDGSKIKLNQGTYTKTVRPSSARTEGTTGYKWNYPARIVAHDGNYAYSNGGGVGNTAALVGTMFPAIPTDSKVVGLLGSVVYSNTSVPRPPYFNQIIQTMRLSNNNINVSKSSSYVTGGKVTTKWFGSSTDMWGITGTPASKFNQGIDVKYSMTIDSGKIAYVDSMYLNVYYKLGSGYFLTGAIEPPELPSHGTKKWDQIICDVTIPQGTTLKYDVLEDIDDQKQTSSNRQYPFGQGNIQLVYQNFVPSVSNLSGVWVKAGSTAKIGNPTGNIKISIKEQGVDEFICSKIIDKSKWKNNAEIFVPFDATLTAGKTHSIIWGVDEGRSDTNYYQMAYINENKYSSGAMGDYKTGIGYKGIDGGLSDAWFKTTHGKVLLTDKSNPIDVSNLPFKHLRLKVKFSSTNQGNTTPTLNKVTAYAKVIDI